jgi:hypothetical protein
LLLEEPRRARIATKNTTITKVYGICHEEHDDHDDPGHEDDDDHDGYTWKMPREHRPLRGCDIVFFVFVVAVVTSCSS